jgi:hypothetical protein
MLQLEMGEDGIELRLWSVIASSVESCSAIEIAAHVV